MTGEGREHSERPRETDEDDTERVVREIIDEVRKEIEEREASETEEDTEKVKDPEECVREAIEEIRLEEEERQRKLEEYEEREREKEEQLEESREEREEKADKDDFAELEERVLENFEDYGIDPEDVKERWRERFEEDVEEQLDGAQESDEKEEGKDGEEQTVESEVYYTDSNGQVHVVKTESNESVEEKVEPALEEPEQLEEPVEAVDTPESHGTEPSVEEDSITPQDEHVSDQKDEVTEHSHPQENTESNEEVEKLVVESEHKEATPERTGQVEEDEDSYSESESTLDVDEPVENHRRREDQESGSEESDEQLVPSPEVNIESDESDELEQKENCETDTDSEESSERPESREEEIWTSYEMNNGSLEDEEWKRYLRETYNSLPEEEREEFKEYLRSQVQTIEEFEELLRKYGLEELADEEEVMDEVRRFLEFKQALKASPDLSVEEIANELEIDMEQAQEWSKGESEPLSLKKLLNLEAYFLWDEILRSYRERDYPKTEEELERKLAEHDELRSSRFLSIEHDEALAWIEITKMRRRGEIRKIIRNGRELYHREQMKELSEKYGIAANEIIRWLRGETTPSLIEKTCKVPRTRSMGDSRSTEIDTAEVHRLYFEEGLSMLDTAKILGFKSAKPVQCVFKEQQWTPRAAGPKKPIVELDEVHRLYFVEGRNLREIAQRVGIDRHTLGGIFRKQGWITRRTAAIKRILDAEKIRQMHFEQGLPLKKISSLLGVSKYAIGKVFREQGWKPRRVAVIKQSPDTKRIQNSQSKRDLSSKRLGLQPSTSKNANRKGLNKQGKISVKATPRRKAYDLNELYRLYYEEGWTFKEIADKVGMHRHTISRIFREQGWESSRTAAIKRMKSITLAAKNTHLKRIPRKNIHVKGIPKRERIKPIEVYQLYCVNGLTLRETADRLGLKTTRPIRRILKDHRWTVRSHERIDFNELYRLHLESNLSLGKIAKATGLTVSTIRKAFKERGLKARYVREKKDSPDIDRVYELYYEKGLTKEEVAEELNASESSIRRVFKEMGWPSKVRKFGSKAKRRVAKEESKQEIAGRIVELREQLFGVTCRICGASNKQVTLAIHRKDGVEHSKNILWRARFLRTVNPDQWASLCTVCHPGVHWMMNTFNLKFEQIKQLSVLNHKKENTEEKLPYQLESDAQVSQKYMQIKQDKLDERVDLRRLLFGDSCSLCGVHYSKKTLSVHRKDGKQHSMNLIRGETYLSKLNPDEWISLCQRCHRETHWAMNKLGMRWEDLERLRLAK